MHFLLLIVTALPFACKGDLIFLGDSHTSGGCADDPCTPFTEIAAEELAGTYNVSALGFGGRGLISFAFYEEPFASEVAPYVDGADVSVMLGTNDIRYGDGVPPAWIEIGRGLLRGKLITAGARSVVFNTPPPHYYLDSPEREAKFEEYHDLLTGEGYGPDNWEFLSEEHFPIDPHMNQAGHVLLGQAMAWFWLPR
jgi:hypothetical protein